MQTRHSLVMLGCAVGFLFATVNSAYAQRLTGCPNTVRIAGNCDTYVAPPPGPSFVSDQKTFGGTGLRVLYAPSWTDDPGYRGAIAAALGGGATVDYWDAFVSTPTVADLSAYDAVVTWTNNPYADRVAFGNNLATYHDAGGIVILGVFTTYDGFNSIGGAIRDAGYSPVANPTGDNHFALDGWAGDGHLFYSGISLLECAYRDILVPQGGGVVSGTYLGDGEVLGAYNPANRVRYMNGEGHNELTCSGDWDRLTANMILTAGSGGGPSIDIAITSRTTNPMRGRSVFFRGPVTNNGSTPEYVYIYFTVDVPGQGTYKTNLGGITLGPGQTFQYKNFPKSKNYVPLPLAAPAGTYTVTLYAASDAVGTVVYDTASFQFTLLPLATVASLPGTTDLKSVEPGASPNPFRDHTEITYALVEDAGVDLRVFDVTGREVAALVSGAQSAGTHTATLRAGDLPSGVYVWRLTIGGEVTTGRVTLAR